MTASSGQLAQDFALLVGQPPTNTGQPTTTASMRSPEWDGSPSPPAAGSASARVSGGRGYATRFSARRQRRWRLRRARMRSASGACSATVVWRPACQLATEPLGLPRRTRWSLVEDSRARMPACPLRVEPLRELLEKRRRLAKPRRMPPWPRIQRQRPRRLTARAQRLPTAQDWR
jgi:hypothetical protein